MNNSDMEIRVATLENLLRQASARERETYELYIDNSIRLGRVRSENELSQRAAENSRAMLQYAEGKIKEQEEVIKKLQSEKSHNYKLWHDVTTEKGVAVNKLAAFMKKMETTQTQHENELEGEFDRHITCFYCARRYGSEEVEARVTECGHRGCRSCFDRIADGGPLECPGCRRFPVTYNQVFYGV